MARYDVHAYPSGGGFLLDVQSDLLDDLNTRVVVPLLPRETAPRPARKLNPVFDIGGQEFIMVTQFLSAVAQNDMGPKVHNLEHCAFEIATALDMVFQGF